MGRLVPAIGALLFVLYAPGASAGQEPETPKQGEASSKGKKHDEPARPRLELRDGDRIAFIGATLLERDRHFGYFESVQRSRYPGLHLSFSNMAWPGDTTTVQLRPLNFGSLEEHLARQKPSVAIVCYGSNEAFDGPAGLNSFLDGYRKLLDTLANTCRQVVLVSPIRHENLGPPLPDPAAHNENLGIYTKAIAKLAEERGLPFVDLFHGLDSRSGSLIEAPLTDNGIHLNTYGYWRAATALADSIGPPAAKWSVEIAADTGDVAPGELQVAEASASKTGVRFTATAQALAVPAPQDRPPGARLGGPYPVLRVKGLDAGRYVLAIDGKGAATATAEEWTRGQRLADFPDFVRGDALREEVVWKNLLFFNRWRAHNGEYIYGRRSKTSEDWSRNKDGGNAGNPSFPGEMAKLERLIEESDRKADELAKPVPHVYELRRVD
jgi:hypothetical protein